MERISKPKKKKKNYIHHRNVINTVPLEGELKGLNNSHFLDKVDSGQFDKRNFKHVAKHGGRTKFKNDFMRQVYYLAKGGFRTIDIAEFFNVDASTIELWKQSNKEFLKAYREGTYMMGFKAVESLTQRLLGYDYVEVEKSQHLDKWGKVHELTKVVHKHMPPDVEAIKFYLKNRFKDNWSDTTRTEIEAHLQVDLAKRLDMSALSEQERNLIKSIAIKQIQQVHGISNE
jgi:hypothetical protein